MYSLSGGLKPLRPFDAWFGAHQRIDRYAMNQLEDVFSDNNKNWIISRKQLLNFEGIDGPDGIKLKTPAQGEPWHYYNPFDESDTAILDIIKNHHSNLVKALRRGNRTRAAFEAAWMAHALVDGLTPAHHYPYEAELTRLRGGKGIETRTSYRDKLIAPGDTVGKKFKNNWEMVGDKGLMSTHMMFEFGVAVLIVPMGGLSKKKTLNAAELALAGQKDGYLKYFKKSAKEIANLKLYEKFYKAGWTPGLAKQVRGSMIPKIVNTVTLAWYSAALLAEKKP